MKKGLKIAITIIVLLVLGYGIFMVFYGQGISLKDKIEIKKYAETYLTKKYGEHKFKVTSIEYEYVNKFVDHSNPIGYSVFFKCDVVSNSWIKINGLTPDTYKINGDYLIESYYFSGKDENEVQKLIEKLEPKSDLEEFLLDELRNEFDSNIYEVNCNSIVFDIPEDYGKIPLFEEFKTNISLYKVTNFSYKLSTTIEDTKVYEERLKAYIKDKYNVDSNIFFYSDDTLVSVYLNY